ncbi:uncharacterized protein LOC119719235 [Patiria miniata]|uniref:Uncharacterized protein n=1 Tax=Patiria miniata TaxID=46514 RepID=A0A913YYA2_PATMI|nr:uncharacterized protein LOC119719235 [Patiria miniata]
MAGHYDLDDNVVPDLQCYEMLPADAELQIAQAFAGNEPTGAFKPKSPVHHASLSALPVALHGPSGCLDENLLQVPYLASDGLVGSSSEPDGLEGAVFDSPPDIQTVPSLQDTPRGTAISASSHSMARFDHQSVSSSDDSTSRCVTATSTAVSHSPYEVPDMYANLLGLLMQHREQHVKWSPPARFDDRNCGRSDLQFDGRCDCDVHLVPRWDIEE